MNDVPLALAPSPMSALGWTRIDKVLAVFQGHSHQNDLKDIHGIHYCTLVAMIEGSGDANNGYSVMELEPNGTIRLTGFRKQKSHKWLAGKRRKLPL